MLFVLIIVIINILIVISMHSQLSLTTSQYENHITDNSIERTILQEKMLLNAAESYCKTNIDECFSALYLDRIVALDREELIPYLPDSINLETHNDVFFQNVYIDLDAKEIGIVSNIIDQNLKNMYFQNKLNKQNPELAINCIDNGSDCVKTKKMSIKLENSLKELDTLSPEPSIDPDNKSPEETLDEKKENKV